MTEEEQIEKAYRMALYAIARPGTGDRYILSQILDVLSEPRTLISQYERQFGDISTHNRLSAAPVAFRALRNVLNRVEHEMFSNPREVVWAVQDEIQRTFEVAKEDKSDA